mgnify:CR=1 FL=1
MRELAPTPCSRSKALSSAPTVSSETIFCTTKLLLPSFAPSYQTGLIWGSKLQGQICCTSLFQEQAPWCVLKFACRDMTCLQLANQTGSFFYPLFMANWSIRLFHHSTLSSCRSCVVWLGYLSGSVFWGTCFRSKLPHVYRSLGLVLLGFNKKRVLEHHWTIQGQLNCKSSL